MLLKNLISNRYVVCAILKSSLCYLQVIFFLIPVWTVISIVLFAIYFLIAVWALISLVSSVMASMTSTSLFSTWGSIFLPFPIISRRMSP